MPGVWLLNQRYQSRREATKQTEVIHAACIISIYIESIQSSGAGEVERVEFRSGDDHIRWRANIYAIQVASSRSVDEMHERNG